MFRILLRNVLPLAAIALVISISLAAYSQTAPSMMRAQTLKVDVDLVMVNATVSDRTGRIVIGLRPESFQVWEDKFEQKIEYFSEESLPLTVGLIFDVSGSMGDKLSASRDAAAVFLKTGTAEDEYFLVEFSDRPKITQTFTKDISRLEDHLIVTQAKGTTSLFDAVYLGLDKIRNSRNPRKALLIITDGEDNHSRYTLADLREYAKEQDVQVFVIGIVEPASSPLLEGSRGRDIIENLVGITGGEAFFPRSIDELDDICTKIAFELKNQYVIGYHSTNTDRNGKWRHIHLKIRPGKSQPSLNVRSKTGYYGPGITIEP